MLLEFPGQNPSNATYFLCCSCLLKRDSFLENPVHLSTWVDILDNMKQLVNYSLYVMSNTQHLLIKLPFILHFSSMTLKFTIINTITYPLFTYLPTYFNSGNGSGQTASEGSGSNLNGVGKNSIYKESSIHRSVLTPESVGLS